MPYNQVNLTLEMVNGSVLILILALLVCLVLYINTLHQALKLTWRDTIFFRSPLGIRLAKPMLVLKSGAAVYLALGWGWRRFGYGGPMPTWQLVALLSSITILIIGGLWLIRTLTISRSGERAWVATLIMITLYIVGSVTWNHI